MFIRKSELKRRIEDLERRLSVTETEANRAYKQINDRTYEIRDLFCSSTMPTIGGTVDAIKKHLGIKVEVKRESTQVVVIPTKATEPKTTKKGKK